MVRITNLDTEKIDAVLWRLNKPLTFATHLGLISVPKNFISDGASCPQILWSLCSPMSGLQAEAALLHDFLYSKDSDVLGLLINRKIVDKMFLDAMIADGTNKVRAKTIYYGVRIGGSKSYKAIFSIDKIKE